MKQLSLPRVLTVLLTLVLVVSVAWLLRQRTDEAEEVVSRPIQVAHDGYVGSQQCRECHVKEHESWHASYHRTMTQIASPESVLGDFDKPDLKLADYDFHAERQGDEFWVNMPATVLPDPEDPEGRIDRQIVLVTGSHHMQVYWYPTGEARRLGQFPFVYLLEEEKWIPTVASLLQPPTTPQFPQPGLWNYTCLQCHSTAPRPSYEWAEDEEPALQDARLVNTEVAEFGISCEACHGSGEQHAKWHREHTGQQPGAEQRLVVPSELEATLSSQVCGQCHSVWRFQSTDDFVDWSTHGSPFRPGDEIEEKGRWVLRRGSPHLEAQRELADYPATSVVWPDGMIRVSGREFTGLVESPCYTHDDEARQLSCFSCHTLHADGIKRGQMHDWADDQLKPEMRTNRACLQCHDQFASEEQLAAHTHHATDSTGSNCYNCHMPFTTYGLLKAIRSHRIDSPNAGVSQATGRPTACNQCHLDKTLAWTAQHLSEWYDVEPPELEEDERTIADSVRMTLQGDASQRVLMAWSMGWPAAREASGTDWMTPYMLQLLSDSYPAVRIVAHRSFKTQAGFESFDFDPLEPADDREQATTAMAAHYVELAKESEITGTSETLFDSSGIVDAEKYKRLLQMRIQTPVTLKE